MDRTGSVPPPPTRSSEPAGKTGAASVDQGKISPNRFGAILQEREEQLRELEIARKVLQKDDAPSEKLYAARLGTFEHVRDNKVGHSEWVIRWYLAQLQGQETK